MISSHTTAPAQRPSQYGFGFNVGVQPSGRVSLNHSGAFVLGAATNFQMLPDADVGIIVLTNAGPVGAAEALASEFMDLVQYGSIIRDWRADYAALLAHYHEPVGDLVAEAPPVLAGPQRRARRIRRRVCQRVLRTGDRARRRRRPRGRPRSGRLPPRS